MNRENLILTHMGYYGKMISGSKSGYRDRNPKNIVVFNSNVCTDKEKIWYGDIDITLSKDDILLLSKKLNETIYVLYERDGRFENEEKPILSRYIIKFHPDMSYEINPTYSEYFDQETLTLKNI